MNHSERRYPQKQKTMESFSKSGRFTKILQESTSDSFRRSHKNLEMEKRECSEVKITALTISVSCRNLSDDLTGTFKCD